MSILTPRCSLCRLPVQHSAGFVESKPKLYHLDCWLAAEPVQVAPPASEAKVVIWRGGQKRTKPVVRELRPARRIREIEGTCHTTWHLGIKHRDGRLECLTCSGQQGVLEAPESKSTAASGPALV